MRKKSPLALLAGLFTLAMFSNANATLLGQTVLVEWNFGAVGNLVSNTFSGDLDGGPTTVTADDSDLVQLASWNMFVDMNADGFELICSGGCGFAASPFNGLNLNDLFWASSNGEITGLDITTDIAGWDDSRAAFGSNNANFNFAGLTANANSIFSVNFEANDINVVAESTTVTEPMTVTLLGLGLVGLAFGRRRRVR